MIQNYRQVKFYNAGSRYIDLMTKPIDDDIVECEEQYSIRFETTILPFRVVPGTPAACKVVIRDDDGT